MTPEEEGKALIEKLTRLGLLIDVRPQLFNEGGSTPELGIGRSDQLLFFRVVVPTFDFGPSGKPAPKGISWYRNTSNVWTAIAERNVYGIPGTAVQSATGSNIDWQGVGQTIPYAGDGSANLGVTSGPNFMRHASMEITSAADGSVASVAVIAAGGAGVKWVLYDATLSIGSSGVAVLSGLPGVVALSDSCGYVGAGCTRVGPTKQGTANTAVNVAAAAGRCGNVSTYALNITYRAGA